MPITEHRVAHSASVRLLWWVGNCGQGRKPPRRDGIHWSGEMPTFYEMMLDCIGSINRSQTAFRVDCVSPQTLMPELQVGERTGFMLALKASLEAQTGFKITGLVPDVVDWEGINTI